MCRGPVGRVTGGVCALQGRFQGGTHSPLLLLNPPSNACFIARSVFTGTVNVAHCFPSHTLHLDLTFWALPILLTIHLSQGKLTTAVYRRGEQERVRWNGDYRF